MDDFTSELLTNYMNYNENNDFVVAEGAEKRKVIAIIESLLGQLGDNTSNVFQTAEGALLCYPWRKLDLKPPKKGEKWTVSFRGKVESFVLSLNKKGVLRGHLYSETAEVFTRIQEFETSKVLLEADPANLSFPVIFAKQ
ncbi:MAG: hypothetical protein LBT01_01855 [Spirochaetaceae bacterium]|jgi:hypothetical protein|nr:hypothetical protein [Spirochaetaceae bacterium]